MAPYLLITNGPTGSGKSGLVNKTIEHYELEREHSKFLIDDLVEQNPYYKEQIDKIIRKECRSHALCPALAARLQNPDTDFYKQFGDLYFRTRGKTGDEKHCYKDSKTVTCDALLDSLLNEAVRSGQNIVFETVGTYYVDWLIAQVKEYEYHVVYAFTVLDFCENVRRNKTRALDGMREYIADRRNPAPRLPNVEESHFKLVVKDIGRNLWNLMGRKLWDNLPDVEHIVVFDNTTRDIVVLYDSDVDDSMARMLHAIEAIKKVQHVRRCYMRTV